MNFDQFVPWAVAQGSVGKYNDPNKNLVGECVSLINQYCWRVLGVPAGAWGNAVDWANNGNPNRAYFTKVNSPQRGDVGVMGSNYGGGYGHIFIYTSPTAMIEQNGRTPRKITTGNAYANPIAILRPNNQGAISMEEKVNAGDVQNIYGALLGRAPDPAAQGWVGDSWKDFTYKLLSGQEYHDRITNFQNAVAANADAQPYKQFVIANGKWQAAGGDLSKLEVDEAGTSDHSAELQKSIETLTTENKSLKDELGQQAQSDPNQIVITQKGWAAVWAALKTFFSKNN